LGINEGFDMGVDMKDIVERSMRGGEDSDDFGLWAFGEDFRNISGCEMMESWNREHGDKLKLISVSDPFYDVEKMVDIWRDKKGDVCGEV